MGDEKARNNGSDPFYLDEVFPEAAPIFSFSPVALTDVFDAAIFVLDANALLVPYAADPASLAAINAAYQRLIAENRLLIPGQVAREFAKNRPEKLKTLYDQLTQRQRTSIFATHYPLLAELPEYKNLQRVEHELATKINDYRHAIKGS